MEDRRWYPKSWRVALRAKGSQDKKLDRGKGGSGRGPRSVGGSVIGRKAKIDGRPRVKRKGLRGKRV